jgi:hypothetical protein
MFSVVCWKWQPVEGYRSNFSAKHVNTLRSMVARHYNHQHQFFCITDDPKGIDPRVKIIPLWDDHSKIVNPHGAMNPSCYRRLKAFSMDMRDLVGPRFVSLDLDVVITGDLSPLWNRTEDFVIWGDQIKTTPYNGSMWMMDAGARRQVWEKFDPAESPRKTFKAGLLGSDQAWMSYCLGPSERTWTRKDGVYSYRLDLKRNKYQLPQNARMVFFQGLIDPWTPVAMRACPWIADHYR